MLEDAPFDYRGYRLPNAQQVKLSLQKILSYWPAIMLFVGGVITLAWITALAWIVLHVLNLA